MNARSIIVVLLSVAALSGCATSGSSGGEVITTTTYVSVQLPPTGLGNAKPSYLTTTSRYHQAAKEDLQQSQGQVGKNAIIGLVDTGVDIQNPALRNFNINKKMLGSQGFGTRQLQLEPTDDADIFSNHGTKMAFIILHQVANRARIEVSNPLGYTKDSTPLQTIPLGSTGEAFLANRKLAQQGAHILNNSWNLGKNANQNISLSYIEDLVSAVEYGAMIVKATGNDSARQPQLITLLPNSYPTLKKGFLAVTGVQSLNNLARDHANHCGQAKDWCLTAPMYLQVPDTNGQLKLGSGTSNATAYTSGVAAAVKSRYPWMTNTNLQETLLGTARDIGPAGVDEQFGWGLIQVERAANGYGQLAWGLSEWNIPRGMTSYFNNNISGTGGFRKRGDGTLVLNGRNTFTGESVVQGGNLVVNGTNRASLKVSPQAQLTVGDVTQIQVGGIDVSGTLDATSSSNLVVTGDYVQRSGSLLKKSLGSSIKILGKAQLDGSIAFLGYTTHFAPKQGITVDILTADQGITGQWSINGHSILQKVQLIQDNHRIVAKITQEPVAAVVAASDDYPNKAIVLTKTQTVLDKIENDYQKGNLLSKQQRDFYHHLVSAQSAADLNKFLFQSQNTSIYNNILYMDNLNLYQQQDTLSRYLSMPKSSLWAEYGHHYLRTQSQGFSSQATANQLSTGMSIYLDSGHLGGQVNITQSRWQDILAESSHQANNHAWSIGAGYLDDTSRISWSVLAGYGYIESVVDSRDRLYANQWNLGFKLEYPIMINRGSVLPHLSLGYYRNQLNKTHEQRVRYAVVAELMANMGVWANYYLNPQWTWQAEIDVIHDLQQINKQVVQDVDTQQTLYFHIPKTRLAASTGIVWQPVKNWSIHGTYYFSGSRLWLEHQAKLALTHYF